MPLKNILKNSFRNSAKEPPYISAIPLEHYEDSSKYSGYAEKL